MARIRSIHPEQWTDDDFVTCSALARLLALGLRNQSDDNGIFERNPVKLKMRILPADNCDVPALLEELRQSNQVLFFTAEGREFGIVRSFQRFQKPKSPSFIHPVPSEPLPKGYALSKWYSGSPSEMKGASSTTDSTALGEDWGNRVAGGEERSRREGEEPKTPQAQAAAKVGAPRAHDPREDALRSLFAAERVSLNGKGLLHIEQWIAEGVTVDQVTSAIRLAREHKPNPQVIPAAYLAPIVADLRAGRIAPPAQSPEDVARDALALIRAREARELAASESPTGAPA